MDLIRIASRNGSPVEIRISNAPAIGFIIFMVNNDGNKHTLSIIDFFKNFIESSIPSQEKTKGLINEQDVPELERLFDAWKDAEQAKEEAEMQEQTRKLRDERLQAEMQEQTRKLREERLQAESAKLRARLIKIKREIDDQFREIEVLMSKFYGFHLEFSSEIDSKIELLKSKKIHNSVIESCEALLPTFDSSLRTKDAEFREEKPRLFGILNELIAESEQGGYIFNPEISSFNPEFKDIYLKQLYIKNIKDKLIEFDHEIKKNISASYNKLEELKRKIDEKKGDKKRARLSSVSSTESESLAARSAAASPVADASGAAAAASGAEAASGASAASRAAASGAAAAAAAPPNLLPSSSSSGLPPRHKKKNSLVRVVGPVVEGPSLEAPAVEEVFRLEPEKARDMIRFIGIHDRFFFVTKKEKEEIIKRLEKFESMVESASPLAFSAIDLDIFRIKSLYERVLSQEHPNRLKQLFKKAEQIFELSKNLAEEIGPCEGGGAGGGRGCPEAELAEHAFEILQGRQREMFGAEEAALGALLAEMQADKSMHEEAMAREELEANSGFSHLKATVSEYDEFLEHITTKASEIRFTVDKSINRGTGKRVIFVRARAGRPLHLTLSPEIKTKKKFHITHNQIPEAVDAKRFYFGINFDTDTEENYLYDIIEKRRIEIPEIVDRFREELQKLGLMPSVKELEEEVCNLLQFLLDNIDDSSTKRVGGFYEKYMKYKAKYLALKRLDI